MKKITLIVVLSLCLLLLFGCGGKNEGVESQLNSGLEILESALESEIDEFLKPDTGISKIPQTETNNQLNNGSDVDEFLNYIKNGEYIKAVEIYNDELYGNYQLEFEASDGVSILLEELVKDVLSGKTSENEAEMIMGTVGNVLSEVPVTVEDYDGFREKLYEAVESKAAFLAGKELEEMGEYIEAIVSFKVVLKADSNYREASAAIERCAGIAKENAVTSAEALAKDGRYIEAIQELYEIKEVVLNDSEVVSKITVYEKAYISDTVLSAEEVFVTPAEDYSEALDIINAALQYFPDSKDLNEKKAYYQSFMPVNLYDMESLRGSASRKDVDQDTYGNDHEKCFIVEYAYFSWHRTDISYHLDKSYNTLEVTIYGRSTGNDAEIMTAEIYADGKLLYQNLEIPDNSTPPFTVDFDVTGVEELRIVLPKSRTAAVGIGMTDMIIQRTVK